MILLTSVAFEVCGLRVGIFGLIKATSVSSRDTTHTKNEHDSKLSEINFPQKTIQSRHFERTHKQTVGPQTKHT